MLLLLLLLLLVAEKGGVGVGDRASGCERAAMLADCDGRGRARDDHRGGGGGGGAC